MMIKTILMVIMTSHDLMILMKILMIMILVMIPMMLLMEPGSSLVYLNSTFQNRAKLDGTSVGQNAYMSMSSQVAF